MCFHRWPFIERGLFENFRDFMNGQCGDDNTLQRSAVCLGVMLVCLDVRLTIKVSFALYKKHTLPQQSSSLPPSIYPSPSFSPITLHHWFSFIPQILLYPITSIFF
jgi:hypothetical protein